MRPRLFPPALAILYAMPILKIESRYCFVTKVRVGSEEIILTHKIHTFFCVKNYETKGR